MEVVNDFLSNEQFSELSYWLCGSDIAWFFNPDIAIETEENSKNCYFTHTFYLDDEWKSPLSNLTKLLVDEIKNQMVDTEWEVKSLLRVKGNLYPQTDILQTHNKHFDYSFTHKAVLFYLNDNDGYTEFENGEKIKSQSNRMVLFDGSTLHNSTNCTTEKCRITLGINYL